MCWLFYLKSTKVSTSTKAFKKYKSIKNRKASIDGYLMLAVLLSFSYQIIKLKNIYQMENCNNCLEKLTPLGFATILKRLGIEQKAKHSWSSEKGCVVSNNCARTYTALEKDTSLFTNEELVEIIKTYKEKYEKCINVIMRFDAGIIGMYDL